MSKSRELFGVATHGIASRKVRTLLILLGPVVGVAAMVGAVGLTESAKGDLKEKLASLGTNLITVQAAGSFGQQNPTLPKDAVTRVGAVPTVTKASAVSNVDGVTVLPSQGADTYFQAIPVPVLAADKNLPGVLDVPIVSGRWLQPSDSGTKSRAVVIGSGLAAQYGQLPGEIRTITLNGIDYGVVGVLGPVALDPNLDSAAFVTQYSAKHDFATTGEPTKMYVRAAPGTTQATTDAIPTAISLGGTDQVTTKIPSDALSAASKADKTLQQTALFAGILGGVIGAMLGVGIVYLVSGFAGWVVVIDYGKMPLWIGLAVGVAVIAGLYPSVKAARLEPLETLRLG